MHSMNILFHPVIVENYRTPPTASNHSAPRWSNKLETLTISLKHFTNQEALNAL